jgi:hypothetical protein
MTFALDVQQGIERLLCEGALDAADFAMNRCCWVRAKVGRVLIFCLAGYMRVILGNQSRIEGAELGGVHK